MMETFYIDAIWLSIAFLCGLLARKVGLPPLVGFLFGGFIINLSGFHEGTIYGGMQAMSDIGVMLLLFTIGLKLKFRTLLRNEIWVTASLHMITTIIIVAGLLSILTFTGLQLFTQLSIASSLMVGFALSFSSTVFVVKTLEGKGELDAYHGKIAIGILIIQDIFAVLFITFSSNELPSLWVFVLPLVLWGVKIVLSKLLDQLDHGEMIPVFGFFATFIAGAFSFTLVGLKPDLGALAIGMLLVNHPRADELYLRMAEYKDFFLIAFFINIGFVGLPTWTTVITAGILLPLIFLKGALFFFILSKFKLQPRTSFLTGLKLSNYSEFGLIVGIIGLQIGLMTEEWLVTLALLMSFSFVLASPINRNAHYLFDLLKNKFLPKAEEEKGEDSEPVDFGDAEYLVIGLGEIGKYAYETLQTKYGDKVLGLDFDNEIVEKLKQTPNTNVKWADATDSELWDNVDTSNLKGILLSISNEVANIGIMNELKRIPVKSFKVFNISKFPDQIERYKAEGFDFVFDYNSYIGRAYGVTAIEHFEEKKISGTSKNP